MKALKTALWIFMAAIVQILLTLYVKAENAVPDVLFAFTFAYAARVPGTGKMLAVSIVCGLLSNAILGGEFVWTMLVFVFSGALVFTAKQRIFIVSDALKLAAASVLFMGVYKLGICFAKSYTLTFEMFKTVILPSMISSLLLSMVLYFILGRTFKKELTDSKLLIV